MHLLRERPTFERPDLLLVSGPGGHLLELIDLEPLWRERSRIWVTLASSDAAYLLDGETVVYGHGPTARSLTALVRNSWLAIRLFARVRPRVMLSTGAGLAVPFAWGARLIGCRVFFIECCGRVDRLSLSLRLIAPVAESLYVQWPELQPQHRRAHYFGRIPFFGLTEQTRAMNEGQPRSPGMVMVTVGSSRLPFDRLVTAAAAAAEPGTEILIQRGCSRPPPAPIASVEYLPYGELVAALKGADVVVAHAGIGSVLLALACGKRPIVVPRLAEHGEAVDNHQVAFARRLADLELVDAVEDTDQLANAIASATSSTPQPDTDERSELLEELANRLRAVLEDGSPEPSSLRGELASLRDRAATGIATYAARTIALQGVSLLGTLLLARILAPSAIGAAALGTAVIAFASYTSGGGIAAALVRQADAPTDDDLRSLLGIQLIGSGLLALLAAAALVQFGESGNVASAMLLALPLLAFRTPLTVTLERSLRYRSLALIDGAETLVFYTWAAVTAELGWGAWSIATAVLARTVVGTTIAIALTPHRLLVPAASWTRTRRLLGFGFGSQAVPLLHLARDLALNLATAAIAGPTTLGLWTLANRLLQPPFVIFGALWRVGFPAVSRLLAAGADPRQTVERLAEAAAIATAPILVPLLASTTTLIPALLGNVWNGTTGAIVWATAGMTLAAPASLAATSYLWATGNIRTPLIATALNTLAWLAVGLTLLPYLGATALGVGWFAASTIDAAILLAIASRNSGAKLLSHTAPVALTTITAGFAGYAAAIPAGHSVEGGIIGTLLGELTLAAILLTTRRQPTLRTAAVSWKAARRALASADA